MATLDITASGFRRALSGLNGTRSILLSKRRCIKFAQTVGNSHFSRAFGRTATALALASYRAMAIRCVLDFSQQDVRRSDHYKPLESTEKVNLSYWIGMTFTAIAADDFLNVTRLTHASRQNGLRKVNKKSRSLADLVGQDTSGGWHVLEAKGRQTSPPPQNRLDWKAQARTVRSINNAAIQSRSYCVGLIDDPCYVELVDPSPDPRREIHLKVDPDDFGLGYYEPFFDFLGRDAPTVSRKGRNVRLRVVAYDPIDKEYVYVGLDDSVYALVKAEEKVWNVKEYEDESLYIGRDGVAVLTSRGPCDL